MAQGSLLSRVTGALDPNTIERALLVERDAIDLLQRLPDESIDLLVCDPAYESLEKHRAVGTTTRLSAVSGNAWFPIFPNSRFPEFFRAVYRVLVPDSHFYMLCDQETMFVTKPMAEAVGFKFWRFLVWDKVTIGMGYHYRCTHEVILFFEKGKRRLNDLGQSDVIHVPRVRGGYPTQKPEELLRILITNSSAPGELVLDPFMGSGSTGGAALDLGRRFLGGDLKISDEARERLK